MNMNKKYISLIIVLILIGAGMYVYKDVLFVKNFVTGVNSFNEEMLTRSVTFKSDTPESVILSLKTSLESQKKIDIESVTYISFDQGVLNFKDRHPEIVLDKDMTQALSDTIKPTLLVRLKNDNGGEVSKSLKTFIESNGVSSYIVSI